MQIHERCATAKLTAALTAALRAALATTALASSIAGCSGTHCANAAYFGLPSPDGASIAFIFHRTCTAPASVTTEVSLLPFHESLHADPGNVLIVPGEQPVKVTWHGAKVLSVSGFKNATLQRSQPLDSIAIEYAR